MGLLAGIALVAGSFLTMLHEDYTRGAILWSALALHAAIALWVKSRTHWSAAALFFWAGASGLWVTLSPVSPFAAMGGREVVILDSVSAQAVIILYLFVLGILSTPAKAFEVLWNSLGWVGLCSASVVIFRSPWAAPIFPSSVLGTSSMDACLIAVLSPAVLSLPLPRVLAGLVVFLAIILGGSSTAWFILGGAILGYYASTGFLAVALGVVPAVAGWAFLGSLIIWDGGRFPVWKKIFPWWAEHSDPWIGTGTGTFFWLGQRAQAATMEVPKGGYFTWLHSDWLQLLWEQGAIGLMLGALMYCIAAFKAIRSQDRIASGLLGGFAVMGLSQMPLRFPLCALILGLLMRRVLKP